MVGAVVGTAAAEGTATMVPEQTLRATTTVPEITARMHRIRIHTITPMRTGVTTTATRMEASTTTTGRVEVSTIPLLEVKGATKEARANVSISNRIPHPAPHLPTAICQLIHQPL